jgi:spore maturation protein CgeB
MERLPKLDQFLRYDVAFWAAESHPTRTHALDLLSGKFDCEKNGTEKGKNMYTFKRRGKAYLKELGRCKINLSFRGGGFDTLRYWEVPAVGSMLLSEEADIEIPNNFINEESAIFCSTDLSDLIDKAEYYLKHEEKRKLIAKNGFNHLSKYHTDVERAQSILSTIN